MLLEFLFSRQCCCCWSTSRKLVVGFKSYRNPLFDPVCTPVRVPINIISTKTVATSPTCLSLCRSRERVGEKPGNEVDS